MDFTHIFDIKADEEKLFEYVDKVSISRSILEKVSLDVAINCHVLPLLYNKGVLVVLMSEPNNIQMIQSIQTTLNEVIDPLYIEQTKLLHLISKHYQIRSDNTDSGVVKKKMRQLMYNPDDDATTLVNDLIYEAVRLRSSDIHLEPFEEEMKIRFRIDGILQEMMDLPSERIREVTSRIKIMAQLDIAEKRLPQDGRITVTEMGRTIDLRVSTMPKDSGEKIVLRILDKTVVDLSLESVGFTSEEIEQVHRAISKPNGIIIITGPTGSGKSTTLYSCLNYLKKPGVNISTIEDPIEYNIPDINQAQVQSSIGLTFASYLRTLLRQDPNIIMIGEMRDTETAEIAMQASQTGHLVLTTLHTNDAPSAITRLVDMKVESFKIASSLTMIIAQRLVRKVCTHCKCSRPITLEEKTRLAIAEEFTVAYGIGCSQCNYTGYRGRTGIFEILEVNDSIREEILTGKSSSELKKVAQVNGYIPLKSNALRIVREGVSTVEEIIREISVVS